MKLSEALLNYRIEKLWTQKKMAEEIGVALATYLKTENGGAVSLLTKAKMLRFLGKSDKEIELEVIEGADE